jgi:hypothetical protein
LVKIGPPTLDGEDDVSRRFDDGEAERYLLVLHSGRRRGHFAESPTGLLVSGQEAQVSGRLEQPG